MPIKQKLGYLLFALWAIMLPSCDALRCGKHNSFILDRSVKKHQESMILPVHCDPSSSHVNAGSSVSDQNEDYSSCRNVVFDPDIIVGLESEYNDGTLLKDPDRAWKHGWYLIPEMALRVMREPAIYENIAGIHTVIRFIHELNLERFVVIRVEKNDRGTYLLTKEMMFCSDEKLKDFGRDFSFDGPIKVRITELDETEWKALEEILSRRDFWTRKKRSEMRYDIHCYEWILEGNKYDKNYFHEDLYCPELEEQSAVREAGEYLMNLADLDL
jgi:hypothetical protein